MYIKQPLKLVKNYLMDAKLLYAQPCIWETICGGNQTAVNLAGAMVRMGHLSSSACAGKYYGYNMQLMRLNRGLMATNQSHELLT